MNNTNDDLPPEIEALAEIIDSQPIEVQELFRYCLAIAMCEAGKFELLSTSEVGGRVYCSFRSAEGEVFSIVRPDINRELEAMMHDEVLKILREEGLL